MPGRPLSLGRTLAPSGPAAPFELPPHHLVTHAAVVGMTGSGKTGLLVGLVEEALRSEVPVLVLDVKGDLPNLFLAFPGLPPEAFEPWVDADAAARGGKTPHELALEHATRWRAGLEASGLGLDALAAHVRGMAPRLLTPGTTAGEPVSMLSALEARSAAWDEDEEPGRRTTGRGRGRGWTIT
ncbi:MAG: DUF853 family protein [Myxococcales bacterium]|nr:DUF853 family protein [Myxococcales bacterium]